MTERWNVAVVSVGDVLRMEIAAGSLLGQEAARYMDHGRLVPDTVAVSSIENWLDEHQQAFVFDGFPRTVGQAKALDEMLVGRRSPLTAVLWMELPVTMIEERVSRRVVCADCGRSFQIGTHVENREQVCPVCGGKLAVRHDDDPVKLAERMEQYRLHTEPVMSYYEQQGLLRCVVATGTPDEVFTCIEGALESHPQMEAATR